MELKPGSVIDDKYEIVRLIGEGGMGAVFEGRNRLIERRVAIKVLHASARAAEGVVERFEREARAAGRIGGDHVLEVLDLGSLPTGDRYMVMEYLDGETLAQRITRLGRMTCEQFFPILRQALVGLSAVHAAGIVHRDLKPDNLFIMNEKAGRRDFLKIIDFGVSKFGVTGGDMSMTRTGSVMGTPYYMSPEQAKGSSQVNHQSDLYSMGVIAFEALTGAVPFDGTSFNDLMFKIVLNEMPSLEQVIPGVDPAFSAIVRRATAKDLSHRYQTAAEFLADLDTWAKRRGLRFSGTQSLNPTAGTVLSPPINVLPSQAKNLSTKSEWTRTGTDSSVRKPKTLPIILGGVVALAVAAGAALLIRGGEPEAPLEPTSVSASTPLETPKVEIAPEPPKAAPEKAPEPAPEKAEPPPEKAAPGPEPTPAPVQAATRATSTKRTTTTAKATTSSTKTVTSADASRAMIEPPPPVAPVEKKAEPAPKPAPTPARPSTSAGRDFGY